MKSLLLLLTARSQDSFVSPLKEALFEDLLHLAFRPPPTTPFTMTTETSIHQRRSNSTASTASSSASHCIFTDHPRALTYWISQSRAAEATKSSERAPAVVARKSNVNMMEPLLASDARMVGMNALLSLERWGVHYCRMNGGFKRMRR